MTDTPSPVGLLRGLDWALSQGLDHSGYLKKRQARAGGFVKRYFELRGGILVHYAREGGTPKGHVDLRGARVRESKEWAVRPRNYANTAIFLDAAHRSMVLFPKTDKDSAAWHAALANGIILAQVSICTAAPAGFAGELSCLLPPASCLLPPARRQRCRGLVRASAHALVIGAGRGLVRPSHASCLLPPAPPPGHGLVRGEPGMAAGEGARRRCIRVGWAGGPRALLLPHQKGENITAPPPPPPCNCVEEQVPEWAVHMVP